MEKTGNTEIYLKLVSSIEDKGIKSIWIQQQLIVDALNKDEQFMSVDNFSEKKLMHGFKGICKFEDIKLQNTLRIMIRLAIVNVHKC